MKILNDAIYPLGHTNNEISRLESQAKLFDDSKLGVLSSHSKNCLEIGSGVGSNLFALRKVNPKINYTGIDLSVKAVNWATQMYGDPKTKFKVMDCLDLKFKNEKFDFVFSKLVLWSVGPLWQTSLNEIYRVLKPGGIFYSFEPYNEGMVFSPDKPRMKKWVSDWEEVAIKKGLDPHVGPKIPNAMLKMGFKNINTEFFSVIGLSSDKEKYFAVCDNLKNFYFGDANTNPGSKIDRPFLKGALKELYSEGLIMDSFFVTWGFKPNSNELKMYQ